jgi:uncharacterized membrane protein YbhN (UPF0104 family)
MKKQAVRKIFFLALHSIGFVFLFLILKDLEFKKLFRLILEFPLWKIMTGLVLLLMVYIIKTIRWFLINKAFGIASDFYNLLLFFLAAGFLGVITPGRLGELVKIFFLKKKYNISMPLATASVLLDRIWDVLILSLMGCISITLIFTRFQLESWSLILIIIISLLSILIIIFPGLIFLPALYVTKNKSINAELKVLYELWGKSRFKLFIPGFVLSLVSFLLLALIPLMFSVELNAPVSYITGIGAVSISNILSILPITIAGFGTRELVFLKFWEFEGYQAEIAVSVSTAYFVVTYLGSLLLGGIVYIFRFRRLYSIREIIGDNQIK